jgi:hypothetical protein
MIYRKLTKLKKQKRDIESLINAAYQSKADPEVVILRVGDLQWDLSIVEKEIEEEKMMLPFKLTLTAFVVGSIGLLIYGLTL